MTADSSSRLGLYINVRLGGHKGGAGGRGGGSVHGFRSTEKRRKHSALGETLDKSSLSPSGS